MSNSLTVLEQDAIAVGEAIASAVTSGSGTATLQAVQANVAGKTIDVTASVSVSKGTAPAKGSAITDAIRLGEAFAQAFLTGTASATLDAFGINIAGTELSFGVAVAVSAR